MMLKIPGFIVLSFVMTPRVAPTFFAKSGLERMLVFPGISKMDFPDDAENPMLYGAWL